MNRLEGRVERLEKEHGGNPILFMTCRVDESRDACWARQNGKTPLPSKEDYPVQVWLHIE